MALENHYKSEEVDDIRSSDVSDDACDGNLPVARKEKGHLSAFAKTFCSEAHAATPGS